MPKRPKLELRVDAERNDSLAEFLAKLEAKELIVYRGLVAAETLSHVARLIDGPTRERLRKATVHSRPLTSKKKSEHFQPLGEGPTISPALA